MVPQNLQTENSTRLESTKGEFVELFSNINQVLSEQGEIQLNVTLTRADAHKIKIDVNSQTNGTGKKILTPDEVCEMLKITKRALYKYAKMGIVPGLKLGREWRFEADSIFELFKM